MQRKSGMKCWFAVQALWLFSWILPLGLAATSSQIYSIQVITQPSGAVGGEPFAIQPQIAVYDQIGLLSPNLIGYVYAEIGSSPSGYEKLWQGTCNVTGCGVEAIRDNVKAYFDNGVAIFENLSLQTLGTYTIKFVAVNSLGTPFSYTYSNEFTVTTGYPYTLVYIPYFGHPVGGKPFQIQPSLKVTDRGGNLITDLNSGTVTVSLVRKPALSSSVLLPLSNLQVPFISGVAQFKGLFINTAGYPYQLAFSTDLDLSGTNLVYSSNFTVSIGGAEKLNFVGNLYPSGAVLAGEYFNPPPSLEIRDAGGNLLVHDSMSECRISMNENPTNAVLVPNEHLSVRADRGIIRFTGVRLDGLISDYFRFKFQLYLFNASTLRYSDVPSVELNSEYFSLQLGKPRQILQLRKTDHSWAGGQPFEVQPQLAITDYAKNVISTDSTTNLTATLLPSLSAHAYRLVVDTSAASAAKILDIYLAKAPGTYGVGEQIDIHIFFDYEVWVADIGNDISLLSTSMLPSLVLNILHSNGQNASAWLNIAYPTQKTKELVFTYIIEAYDEIPNNRSLVLAHNALVTNTTSAYILDGNYNLINATMEAFTIPDVLFVDTSLPTVVSLGTDTADGEYGTGQEIFFFVHFTSPLIVIGRPYLTLNISRTIAPQIKYAYFSHLNDRNRTAVFKYSVGDTEDTALIRFLNSSILLSPGADILRQATHPTESVNRSFTSDILDNFYSSHAILIDTTPPILNSTYGLQSSSPDGWYYPGDKIYLSIAFDKPVKIGPGISIALLLSVGGTKHIGSATIITLDITYKILYFEYLVTAGTNISQLDIYPNGRLAIQDFGDRNFILRRSTVPTVSANISTAPIRDALGNTLRMRNRHISLYGLPPTVQRVNATATNSSGTSDILVYTGEKVLIHVQFNVPIICTCSPILVIQTLHVDRSAVLIGGNGTNTWTFEYTVELGDSSPTGLYYRHLPNALCSEPTCHGKKYRSCKILAASERPSLEIDYVMPFYGHHATLGMLITSHIQISPFHRPGAEQNTTILALSIVSPSNTIGYGDSVYLEIEFSDDVIVSARNYPSLLLNTNHSARYYSGSGSKKLTFLYDVQLDDNTLSLNWMNYPNENAPVKMCDDCKVTNRISQNINFTVPAGLAFYPSVRVDTSPPVVTTVWCENPTSPYDGWYTAGQLLRIHLLYDVPVHVSTDGISPQLRLQLNTLEPRWATFNRVLSNSTDLTYDYIVQYGDFTDNLMYDGIDSLVKVDDSGAIWRDSANPTTEAIYLLPSPMPLGRSGNIIRVNATSVPQITHVSTNSSDGDYAAGDIIYIFIHFTHHVVVTGQPYLNIHCGNHIIRAQYLPDSHSNVSKAVTFQYIVGIDDFNPHLDYVDIYSLQRGFTIEADLGSILSASTFPLINASLILPSPGTAGSLSASSKLSVDGRAPYVTTMRYLNPSETKYNVEDTILIEMNFSKPVIVFGTPFILLETGLYDRPAPYLNGSGTSRLLFEYRPQIGDMTRKLDYHVDRTTLQSASNSFQMKGIDGTGKIFALSSNPVAVAHVHLNSLYGSLSGRTQIEALEGLYTYRNLSITRHGPDFEVMYSATPTSFNNTSIYTRETVYNSFSNEYVLLPHEMQKGDRIGWSVATNGFVSVLGAPYTNKVIKDVQTVSITLLQGTRYDAVQEVQLLRVELDYVPEIQSFHTTADVYQTIGGYFTLNYGILGPTRPIPANANAEMIEVILTTDIPKLGSITVSREPYIYCACNNAYNWTITFNDLVQGNVNNLILDGSSLVGSGASIIGPFVIQNSSQLGGTFTLLNEFNKETAPIPYDIDDNGLIEALATIDIPAIEVQISPSNTAGCRTWTITFGAINGSYEIPLLKSNDSGITGGVPTIWHTTPRPGRHGPPTNYSMSGVSGDFQLEWRGNVTTPLSFHAEAATVKAALEALPVIEEVHVVREDTVDKVGYKWIITFERVYKNTPRGYVLDDYGEFDALIAHNHLIGTNTSIVIGSKSLHYYADYGDEVRGQYGNQTGAVYIFQRTIDDSDEWIETVTILGNDTDPGDQFGHSVALSGEVLVIGAIGAETNGVPEIQSLYCNASDGYFTLYFRGWTSALIPHNVTRTELKYHIESVRGGLNNLYAIQSVNISDWGDGPLCENHTVFITFEAPVDGALMTIDGRISDLELLSIDTNNLMLGNAAGILNLEEIQSASKKVDGSDSYGQQTGEAYVYRAYSDCHPNELKEYCTRKKWVQESQFFPTQVEGHERFGSSVASCESLIAVGAPGTNGGKGSVYVYKYDTILHKGVNISFWSLMRKYSAEYTSIDWVSYHDDEFGYDVSLLPDVMAVGTPGRNDSRGMVYIFRMSRSGIFVASQQLILPDELYQLSPGDRYGLSVSAYGNMIAVGAPGFDDTTIYLGHFPSSSRMKDTGAVFLFRRANERDNYRFDHQLIPSNVRRLDGFGFDVSFHQNTIVVSAVENMLEGYVPSKAIFEIQTSADYNKQHVGNYFRLKWVTTNETGEWIQRTTRNIPKDVVDWRLQRILEEDLGTGPLYVVRSLVDQYDGGYIWTVAFLSDPKSSVAPFEPVDDSSLTGTNAKVVVRIVNPTPPSTRSKVHLFTRLSENHDFEEQAYLTPYHYQRIDRCGWSVAIFDDYALVGCPNRDYFQYPDKNSGAAFVFKLDFLNLQFKDLSPTVLEGERLPIEVVRNDWELDTPSSTLPYIDEATIGAGAYDILYYLTTLDRNAFSRRQTLISNLFGLQNKNDIDPFTLTSIDVSETAGSAIARSQFYGSEKLDHVWVDGMYDYRGLSDYVETDIPLAFLQELQNQTSYITVTDDTILEVPDETVTLLLHSPGYWPSILGRLTSSATIEDDADGYVTLNETTSFEFDKLYPFPLESDDHSCVAGVSTAVEHTFGILVNGCSMSTVSGIERGGHVLLYKYLYGHWGMARILTSPFPTVGGLYGDAVAVDFVYGRNLTTLVVGEPGRFQAHVYNSRNGLDWDYDTNLTVSTHFVVQHRYASLGTVALDDDIIVIGAPGLEVVYVYTRRYHTETSSWKWSQPNQLHSLDFDYDIIFTVLTRHHQHFGTSVGISGRTIAAGSPYADYDKLASDNVEVDWMTEGTDIKGFSRGRVYLFTSDPSIQNITLVANHQLFSGGFFLRFDHRNISSNTSMLRFNASAEDVQESLERLPNIDRVSVTQAEGRVYDHPTGDDGYYYSWAITFLSEWSDPPLLVPFWNETDCLECQSFDTPAKNLTSRILVSQVHSYSDWVANHYLAASDKRRGDRFGSTLAIDGNTVIVGAIHSAAVVTTTWDFENGNLQGWKLSGTAFLKQPTFGDNVQFHTMYSNPLDTKSFHIRTSGLRGRYYVSTFELRPGDPQNYRTADSSYPQGNIQGDGPTGTMESEIFIILGTKISFLIGGGCNPLTEYVELYIDGMSVARHTGRCTVEMRRVEFDVSLYMFRSSYIKIVDAGAGGLWDHISVDDFQFDWDVKGGLVNASNQPQGSRPIFGGLVETSRSGAVYVFNRRSSSQLSQNHSGISGEMYCTADILQSSCHWSEITKLTPSDKRAGDEFGSSLSINEDAGLIVVSSPFTSFTGFYRETPSLYPYRTEEEVSDISGLQFPLNSSYETYFFHQYTLTPEPSGSDGVMYWRDKRNIFPDIRGNEQVGAVYIYTIARGMIDHHDHIYQENSWKITEHCKIQSSDAFSRDYYGSSISLSGSLLAIGAKGQDGYELNHGAIYLYHIAAATVRFEKPLFIINENYDRPYITITVVRDLSIYDERILLEYATSDLTAQGIDSIKYQECLRLPKMLRGAANCGDYEHTRGIMVLDKGRDRSTFTVGIVDDLCQEKFMKFIQLTLSIPGTNALQGEAVSAQIRIDDNDDIYASGHQYCSTTPPPDVHVKPKYEV